MLGPLLLLLFVSDLPDWIMYCMRMFTDDVKIWNVIRSEWSSKWLLKLNPSKCKVMHIGHSLDTT